MVKLHHKIWCLFCCIQSYNILSFLLLVKWKTLCYNFAYHLHNWHMNLWEGADIFLITYFRKFSYSFRYYIRNYRLLSEITPQIVANSWSKPWFNFVTNYWFDLKFGTGVYLNNIFSAFSRDFPSFAEIYRILRYPEISEVPKMKNRDFRQTIGNYVRINPFSNHLVETESKNLLSFSFYRILNYIHGHKYLGRREIRAKS